MVLAALQSGGIAVGLCGHARIKYVGESQSCMVVGCAGPARWRVPPRRHTLGAHVRHRPRGDRLDTGIRA